MIPPRVSPAPGRLTASAAGENLTALPGIVRRSRSESRRVPPRTVRAIRGLITGTLHSMRYVTITDVPQDAVLRRAKQFFSERSHVRVAEETEDTIVFAGRIGMATLRVDHEGGHTNVHVETDRGAGLDVTDLAKRFLYTLEHV